MPGTSPRTDDLVLAGLALAVFLFQLLASVLSGYGFFIDELYFIACSRRLDLGYVDQPPLSIVALAASRTLLGESIGAIRFLPALASGATVFATGNLARELGGSRPAMLLAALAAAGMPVLLVFGSYFSMNAFEPLLWVVAVTLAVRMVRDDRPRTWIAIGAVLGIGLETKHTMVLYAAALVLGLLATPERRFLRTRWFLLGCGVAALLLLPNVLWQVAHGFPSLELYRNSMGGKNIARAPWEVLRDQVLFANPFSLPLWVAGLAWLAAGAGRSHRYLAWAYLLLLLAMVAAGSSRPDRIAAMYPVLHAAGAVAIAGTARSRLRAALLGGQASLLAAGAIAAAPIFTPLLPPADVRAYLSAIGLSMDLERGKRGEPVPQWLADRLGWEELAAKVAEVVRALPPEDRRDAVIVSNNYGAAGALERFGAALGLPPVFATHNSFHDWGPPPETARVYVGVDVDRAALERRFDTVVEAAVAICDDCTRPQRRVPIYVARGPRFSVRREWPGFRNYH